MLSVVVVFQGLIPKHDGCLGIELKMDLGIPCEIGIAPEMALDGLVTAGKLGLDRGALECRHDDAPGNGIAVAIGGVAGEMHVLGPD